MNPSGSYGSNGDAATDNPTSLRDLYAGGGGNTLGVASGAASTVTTSPVGAGPAVSGTAPTAASLSNAGFVGQPLTWWATLIILFLALGIVARKAGNEGEFGNIRASAYNILMITFAAIIGIAGMKALFTRFTVPGISTLVQAV